MNPEYILRDIAEASAIAAEAVAERYSPELAELIGIAAKYVPILHLPREIRSHTYQVSHYTLCPICRVRGFSPEQPEKCSGCVFEGTVGGICGDRYLTMCRSIERGTQMEGAYVMIPIMQELVARVLKTYE